MRGFIAILFVATGLCYAQEYPKITIYYSTQDAASINFLNTQFFPAYDALLKDISVELIPFGQAIPEPFDAPQKFICKNGLAECIGNKAQACVLNDDILSDKIKMDYIKCTTEFHHLQTFVEKCANDLEISFCRINHCINSQRGLSLQKFYGLKTMTFNPKEFPTILYNDVFEQRMQEFSLLNLTQTICSVYKSGIPDICQRMISG